jgi:hypothetical protein
MVCDAHHNDAQNVKERTKHVAGVGVYGRVFDG